MIAEGIEKVLSLALTPEPVQVFGLPHQDLGRGKGLQLMVPPTPKTVAVTSLDGLVNLLETRLDGFDPKAVLVHVKDWKSVTVETIVSDEYGRRHVYVSAAPVEGLTNFQFNKFMSQEEFVIGLQACFKVTPDLSTLLDLASHIDVTAKVVTEDTGVAQNLELRRTIAHKDSVTVKARVDLAPFRTFMEAEQPTSDFIFRVKDGGLCALFEADGGRWKIDAINNVASWLGNRLKGSTVEGLADIPVIS